MKTVSAEEYDKMLGEIIKRSAGKAAADILIDMLEYAAMIKLKKKKVRRKK